MRESKKERKPAEIAALLKRIVTGKKEDPEFLKEEGPIILMAYELIQYFSRDELRKLLTDIMYKISVSSEGSEKDKDCVFLLKIMIDELQFAYSS